jgi:hypothetical protein
MKLDGQSSIPSRGKICFSAPQRQAGFGTHPTFHQMGMGTGALPPDQGHRGGEADQVFIAECLIDQTDTFPFLYHAQFCFLTAVPKYIKFPIFSGDLFFI